MSRSSFGNLRAMGSPRARKPDAFILTSRYWSFSSLQRPPNANKEMLVPLQPVRGRRGWQNQTHDILPFWEETLPGTPWSSWNLKIKCGNSWPCGSSSQEREGEVGVTCRIFRGNISSWVSFSVRNSHHLTAWACIRITSELSQTQTAGPHA